MRRAPAWCRRRGPETGRPAARITSVAWSPRFDQEIALGYVRRELEPPASLPLGDGRGARIVALPFDPDGIEDSVADRSLFIGGIDRLWTRLANVVG